MSNLTFKRATYEIPHDSQRVSRWTQRLYKILQTHERSILDAECQYKSFASMATPTERTQLRTAYEVIKSAFLGEYDRAKTVTDKIHTPEPTPVVRYDGRWKGDYAAYRHYAKDTAWLESQFSVV